MKLLKRRSVAFPEKSDQRVALRAGGIAAANQPYARGQENVPLAREEMGEAAARGKA